MTSSKKSSSVPPQVIAVAALLVVFVLLVAYGFSSKSLFGGGARLVIDPPQVVMPEGRIIQLHAQYDADGDGPILPVDVTDQVDWSSSDNGVATVNNAGIAKGELTSEMRLSKNTQASVSARFKNLRTFVSVTVQKAGMEISCYPVGLNPKHLTDTIRAGEQIDYIVYFSKIGVPDYTYQWETPEGETSTFVNPIFTFKKPGEKIVKVTVTDKAGSVIDAECKPLTVK